MKRAARWLLVIGLLLFIAVLASQGAPAVLATLGRAGWGLLLVALFHLLPLGLDALAIRVLFDAAGRAGALRKALLTRWVGESVNSLLPGGQLGGPVLMARQLGLLGLRRSDAAAVITVSTTLQTLAQIAFALFGVLLLGARASGLSEHVLRNAALIASAVLAVQVCGFYWLQRRGLFGRVTRAVRRFSAKRDWSQLMSQADSIDAAVQALYRRREAVAASFLFSMVGWVVGVGEVLLILQLVGHPVGWTNALLLESLGQAIRGAAFAVPGALGVQEGGYLLLAPLTGLSPDTALALSLAKRAREILLALPGLLYLHVSGRAASGPARPAGPPRTV